jgi:acyl-CoA thioesterase FadM
MWVADLSRVRCYLEAEFLIGEQMAAKARQMTAFVDQERLRPVRIPADLRNKADLD